MKDLVLHRSSENQKMLEMTSNAFIFKKTVKVKKKEKKTKVI